MHNKTVLVGGAIQHAITTENKFNQDIRSIIELVLFELEKHGYKLLSAHRYEAYGELDVSNQEKKVCARDYRWMNKCDLFIAVLPAGKDGYSVRTDGTCVELGWASSLKKPIVVLNSTNTQYSHLVKGLTAVTSVEYVDIASMQTTPSMLISVIEKLLKRHYEREIPMSIS